MSDETPSTDAEILYGDPIAIASGYRPGFLDPMTRLQDAHALTDADRDEMITDVALAFADAKITSPLAAPLLGRMVGASIQPPDASTIASWEAESRRILRERYGEAESTQRLETVRQFVAARPQFAALVGKGAGSHPAVVAAFAEQAHVLRVTPVRSRR